MNYDQPSDSRDEFRSDQENNNRYYDSPDAGEKLPADPIALTLGIVSLVSFFVFCWCYGVIALITLVISIVGLVLANRSISLYKEEPNRYSRNTHRSVQNGKILNIIGVAVSSLVVLILIVLALFFGSIFYAIIDGDWDNLRDLTNYEEQEYDDENTFEEQDNDWYEYEEELDTMNRQVDSTSYTTPADTLMIDTLQ